MCRAIAFFHLSHSREEHNSVCFIEETTLIFVMSQVIFYCALYSFQEQFNEDTSQTKKKQR